MVSEVSVKVKLAAVTSLHHRDRRPFCIHPSRSTNLSARACLSCLCRARRSLQSVCRAHVRLLYPVLLSGEPCCSCVEMRDACRPLHAGACVSPVTASNLPDCLYCVPTTREHGNSSCMVFRQDGQCETAPTPKLPCSTVHDLARHRHTLSTPHFAQAGHGHLDRAASCKPWPIAESCAALGDAAGGLCGMAGELRGAVGPPCKRPRASACTLE